MKNFKYNMCSLHKEIILPLVDKFHSVQEVEEILKDVLSELDKKFFEQLSEVTNDNWK